MGISFNFINGATIEHLNIRKDGGEEERILAIDVKLCGEAEVNEWITELLVPMPDDSSFYTDFVLLFWMDDDEKNVRFRAIEPIKSEREFRQCQVDYGGIVLNGDTKKFQFKPIAGKKVSIIFSISIKDPDTKTVITLAEMVKEAASCSLYGPDLLDPTKEAPRAERNYTIDFGGHDEDDDDLYTQAVEAVIGQQRASISFVQRELRIGYNRAARMIERMEKENIVSEMDGAGVRVVLLKNPESDQNAA